ncbi:MAG: hypothetical protein NC177_15595 [Ruminococcus flavefaciens]|nr:hypothetical protein [Ruminococcus flavefaciens]
MYDFNGNEVMQKQFSESIENGDIQHIKGQIRRIDGTVIYLREDNLLDDIYYDSQCTADENIFNFGEMYIGSVEIRAKLPNENVNLIKGGELSLFFRTESMQKWIPLGVWDIVSAEREFENVLTIKGYDHLNRLNVSVTDNSVGAIKMESALRQVAKDAKVKFAQNIAEIQEIAGIEIDLINGVWATHFLDTCWNEVRAIAQFLGCFAFANREGKIEFRRFSTKPLLTIPAERRFSAKISDYQYSVKGVSYTDKYGKNFSHYNNTENLAVLGFSDNKYVWETRDSERVQIQYGDTVKRISLMLGNIKTWSPGTVEYYGNPALDVGDMVSIEGGVNGTNNATNFLITQISWHFRGPQMLISGGLGETGTATSTGSSSSSSGSTVTSYNTINTTHNISVIECITYIGEVFGAERFVAKSGFSCMEETWIFLDCTLILAGDGLIQSAVWLDGIAQTLRPKITLHNGENSTLHFSFTTKISGGRHNIQIGVRGNADIADIQAFLWGQGIMAELPEITAENDYIYRTFGGNTTVMKYVGKSDFPQIPDDLGGGKTLYIGKNAFSDSEVKSVYIPDSVTEIK